HWIDRMFPEGNDACQRLTPAIHTFWSGYNNMIFDPQRMDEGTCEMYAERRVLWIVDWVQRYFGTDPARSYAAGGSMGGCGCFTIALRHPEIFAAIAPNVGITTYARGEGGDSVRRVEAYMGGMDTPCDRGIAVGQWLDATRFVMEHDGPLPFVIMSNGRNDGSIPWGSNPPFYRAMQQRRQGLIAAWNAGTHGEVLGLLPDDIRERRSFEWLHRFATELSYPAFTGCSADDDPGDGAKDDGDPTGYVNRGLEWELVEDSPERYELVVRWYLDTDELPVTVDVTPRRVQGFVLKPGEEVTAITLSVDSGEQMRSRALTADQDGLVTIRGLRILSPGGTRLTLTRER
ncbi:MAG: alpha/beta hydrolase-fold protein, partial [Armatimonadota bacterium]